MEQTEEQYTSQPAEPIVSAHEPMAAEGEKASTFARYFLLFAIGTVAVSIVFGILFGALAGWLVAKYFPGGTQNQSVTVESEQSAIISSVKAANPAVVSIIISKAVPNNLQFNPLDPFGFLNNGGSGNSGGTTQQEVGGGSGFIITANGLIVTNKHVASDTSSTYTVILADGRRFTGNIVATDPTNDIAILKINASKLPTVTLGDSSNLQLGQQVIAIGNALGQYANTVSAGVVSGINRIVTASDQSGAMNETLHNVIQTDAQINPGNSGGPLLNISGQVIGINTAIASNAQGIGFAIPIAQAKSDINQVEATGKIVRPQLGLRYEIIDNAFLAANPNTPYTYGAYVTAGDANAPAVISGSPADKAGIKAGDIILEVDGTKVDTTNNLSDLIQKHTVGDTITLKVYDSGKEKSIQVTLSQAAS